MGGSIKNDVADVPDGQQQKEPGVVVVVVVSQTLQCEKQ